MSLRKTDLCKCDLTKGRGGARTVTCVFHFLITLSSVHGKQTEKRWWSHFKINFYPFYVPRMLNDGWRESHFLSSADSQKSGKCAKLIKDPKEDGDPLHVCILKIGQNVRQDSL